MGKRERMALQVGLCHARGKDSSQRGCSFGDLQRVCGEMCLQRCPMASPWRAFRAPKRGLGFTSGTVRSY